MIPQLISADEVEIFRKHLASQGFFLEDLNVIANEDLARILSAWTEWNKSKKLPSAKKAEEPHGFERLEQLKREN